MPAATPSRSQSPGTQCPIFVLFKMVVVAFVWGGTFVAGRIVASRLTPLDGATLRFVVAGIAFVALLFYAQGWRAITPADLIALLAMGLTGIVAYNLFFFAGLQRVSASRAALIVAMNPVGIMLGARLLLGEKLEPRKVLGILVSLVGAAVVVTSRPDAASASGHWGDLFIFGCVVSWVSYTLLARKVLVRVPSLTASAYSTLFGMLVLVAFAAPHASAPKLAAISVPVWAALVFLGVFGTALGFKWYMDGVSLLGAGRAAQFINLVPVFAVLQSMLLLGERPSVGSLFGGMLVIAGLSITQSKVPNYSAQ